MLNSDSKIWILGSPGTGKSYLSGLLSRKLNSIHIELDSLFWKTGWRKSNDSEFRNILLNKISNLPGGYVIDGVYLQVEEVIINEIDIIICLDLPLYIILYRVIKRSLFHLFLRIPYWGINYESIKRLFSKESIINFSINTHKSNKKEFENLFTRITSERKSVKCIKLDSKEQISNFINYCIGKDDNAYKCYI